MIEVLLKKYSAYGRISGEEIYLPFSTGKAFVEECSASKVAILGLDFFHLQPGIVMPVVPINSLDCSIFLKMYENWDDIVRNCNETAMQVLIEEEERDPTQYYNPVLIEKGK
jgi:hypothetical protein